MTVRESGCALSHVMTTAVGPSPVTEHQCVCTGCVESCRHTNVVVV